MPVPAGQQLKIVLNSLLHEASLLTPFLQQRCALLRGRWWYLWVLLQVPHFLSRLRLASI
jgi:hypothetical protein